MFPIDEVAKHAAFEAQDASRPFWRFQDISRLWAGYQALAAPFFQCWLLPVTHNRQIMLVDAGTAAVRILL